MPGNAGYLFYKDYYYGVDWGNLENNKELFMQKSENLINFEFFQFNFNLNKHIQSFRLKTIYPGLVLGTGYHHETGVEGEFKIGFYFDYTTGLPIIPGSSIKGLLRSAFPLRGKLYKDERAQYILSLLNKDESFDLEALELEIFEGIKDKFAKKSKDKYLPISKRDIFYDAFPISVGDNGLFSDDFITPHKEPLKNPIPLRFLKISPGVSFQFNFNFKDGLITSAEKLKLFLNILLDFGIGAKTNVGYGKFEDLDRDKIEKAIEKDYQDRKEELEFSKMSLEERKKTIKQKFIEKINNFDGKPSDLFNEWKKREDLNQDKDVAKAIMKIFKNLPTNPQLKYLAQVLEVNKNELKKNWF